MLGVSFDTREENERFADKFNFPFPLLCDTDHRIGIAYVIGEDGKILQAHPKVDARNYPREQLSSL